MRTTVTFEPDVYSRLKRLSKHREFKPFINEVLRAGLEAIERRALAPTETPVALPVFTGHPRVHDLDNVQRILDDLETPHAA